METQAIASQQSTASTASAGSAGSATPALTGDDFFALLIAQLTNQDPLEPTSNQDLLNQISAIREIELSTNLSTSLTSLTEQQRFASAASLIGQFVSGTAESAGDGGVPASGIVEAVRFDAGGKAVLELEGGSRIPLEEVASIMDARRAAEVFVGRYVTGWDRTDPVNPRLVEGIVTGTSTDEAGRVFLELDTGEALRLAELVDVVAMENRTETGGSAG